MKDMIVALQETISHQGEDIRRLSNELYAQQKETAELRRQLAQLHDKFQAAAKEDTGHETPNQEPPPPHY